MPKDLTKEDAIVGKIVYQWVVKEFEKYDRNKRWYFMTGMAGLILFVYAVISGNYLFALIVVLFAIIMYLQDMLEPAEVPFAITTTGIILGKKFYRYSELKNFWMIYTPPQVKNLYFGLDNVFKHRLQVPLMDYDPRPIRDYLRGYLTEDLEQEEEPLSDRFARLFRI